MEGKENIKQYWKIDHEITKLQLAIFFNEETMKSKIGITKPLLYNCSKDMSCKKRSTFLSRIL